jgi:hypothetical protein
MSSDAPKTPTPATGMEYDAERSLNEDPMACKVIEFFGISEKQLYDIINVSVFSL